MNLSSFFILLGLFCDVAGALLIWLFGIELTFIKLDKDAYLKGNGVLKVSDPTPEERSKYKFNLCLSRIGVFCIIIGFVLQAIGTYINEFYPSLKVCL